MNSLACLFDSLISARPTSIWHFWLPLIFGAFYLLVNLDKPNRLNIRLLFRLASDSTKISTNSETAMLSIQVNLLYWSGGGLGLCKIHCVSTGSNLNVTNYSFARPAGVPMVVQACDQPPPCDTLVKMLKNTDEDMIYVLRHLINVLRNLINVS